MVEESPKNGRQCCFAPGRYLAGRGWFAGGDSDGGAGRVLVLHTHMKGEVGHESGAPAKQLILSVFTSVNRRTDAQTWTNHTTPFQHLSSFIS
ncbi:MAG: hypothetical protein ABW185_13330 [Sedimenticola sp.]